MMVVSQVKIKIGTFLSWQVRDGSRRRAKVVKFTYLLVFLKDTERKEVVFNQNSLRRLIKLGTVRIEEARKKEEAI